MSGSSLRKINPFHFYTSPQWPTALVKPYSRRLNLALKKLFVEPFNMKNVQLHHTMVQLRAFFSADFRLCETPFRWAKRRISVLKWKPDQKLWKDSVKPFVSCLKRNQQKNYQFKNLKKNTWYIYHRFNFFHNSISL